MSTPLEDLVASGSKLWLDSIDPDLVRDNRRLGATGATSNPIIIADLIKSGRFDGVMAELVVMSVVFAVLVAISLVQKPDDDDEQ